MKIRVGYVSIALNIKGKFKATSKLTYSKYKKMDLISANERLMEITKSNLNGLKEILKYNVDKGINFYRVTSNLIPLATHPNVTDWGYISHFDKELIDIGNYIKDNNIRFDSHPDQFNVINSIRPDVVEKTKKELLHQANIFKHMNYDKGKMVLHINSKQGGKEKAIQRFIDNFKTFPNEVTSRLILENEDKSYSAHDILEICQELNIPMVLDSHHHKCYKTGKLSDIIEDIFKTWDNENLPPKLHLSSPYSERSKKLFNKHADYINPYDFVELVEFLQPLDQDFDIMLECKQKDRALLKLIIDVKSLKPEWNWEGANLYV